MGLLARLTAYLNRSSSDETSPALPSGARVNAVTLPGSVDELPEWIRIVPIGAFPNHHNGAHEVTAEHLDEMLTNYERRSTDVLFDFDHNSILNGDTKAAGWGTELEVRDDGLYMRQPDWTDAGLAAINGREYRYLSPVYVLESEDKDGNEAGAWLHSVALTNQPYMDEGEIDPIGNGKPSPGDDDVADPDGEEDPTETQDDDSTDDPSTADDPSSMNERERKRLIALLDLEDEATEEEINEAYEARQEDQDGDGEPGEAGDEPGDGDEGAPEGAEGGEPDEEDVDAKVNAAVEAALAKRDEEGRAKALVDSAVGKGKITPAQKQVWLNSARTDFESTKKQLDEIAPGSAMPRSVNTPAGGGSGDAKVNSRQSLVQHLRAERAAER